MAREWHVVLEHKENHLKMKKHFLKGMAVGWDLYTEAQWGVLSAWLLAQARSVLEAPHSVLVS